jgi:PEGA domain
VRNPTLSLWLSSLLFLAQTQPLLSASNFPQDAGKQPSPANVAQQVPAANVTDTTRTLLPGQFILQDGTPVRLRLSRNVSSEDAHTGDSVDFEVLEDVAVNAILVIPKGSVAIGSVTEAQPKRRMGRAGKLEIVLDYVRLGDTEKAAVRAVKDAKGGSHTAGMTAGIVATGILFFPAAPFFLFMHGKDITVPKGAEMTAYVNGDVRLESKKFASKTDAPTTADAQSAPTQTDPPTPAAAVPSFGSVQLNSTPDGAEVYVDGAFVGNAPATLKLAPGQHMIRVMQSGYKEWSREVTVQTGSEAHLTATLEH